jgi:hypothetical protein
VRKFGDFNDLVCAVGRSGEWRKWTHALKANRAPHRLTGRSLASGDSIGL